MYCFLCSAVHSFLNIMFNKKTQTSKFALILAFCFVSSACPPPTVPGHLPELVQGDSAPNHPVQVNQGRLGPRHSELLQQNVIVSAEV